MTNPRLLTLLLASMSFANLADAKDAKDGNTTTHSTVRWSGTCDDACKKAIRKSLKETAGVKSVEIIGAEAWLEHRSDVTVKSLSKVLAKVGKVKVTSTTPSTTRAASPAAWKEDLENICNVHERSGSNPAHGLAGGVDWLAKKIQTREAVDMFRMVAASTAEDFLVSLEAESKAAGIAPCAFVESSRSVLKK